MGEAAVSREILHKEGFFPEESSGLFVGISEFEDDRFAPVRFAVDDAVDLAWVFSLQLGLVDPKRCVLALAGEPQKVVSRTRLESLLSAGAKRARPGLAKVYQLATELWTRFVPKNPSHFGDCAACPVEKVSWHEAVSFANVLSERAGLESCYVLSCTGTLGEVDFTCSQAVLKRGDCSGYRLPTEAEWEVAARAQTAGSPYPARYGKLEEIAWHGENSGGTTHSVGRKAANAWGLYDMLGNVWEWTGDPVGSLRVFRGGSWNDVARFIRAAYRLGYEPGARVDDLGFRFSLGRARSGMDRGAG